MLVYKRVWKSNTGYVAIFRALLLIIRRAELFNFEGHVCVCVCVCVCVYIYI